VSGGFISWGVNSAPPNPLGGGATSKWGKQREKRREGKRRKIDRRDVRKQHGNKFLVTFFCMTV